MEDLFLIDFDGTISFNDSTDVVMRKHNPEVLKVVREKYKSKEIGIMEFMKSCLESLEITKKNYVTTLKDVKIDKTFKSFLKSGLKYMIVSAGTDLNVTASLEKENIHVDKKLVLSNKVTFENYKVKLEFPYADKEKYFGVDKRAIVLKFKELGYRVFLVGDGPSDYAAAEVADFVFVRSSSRLEKYCWENNMVFGEFSDFEELINEYEELIEEEEEEDFCGTE